LLPLLPLLPLPLLLLLLQLTVTAPMTEASARSRAAGW
jgi:hypothetical protein